MKILTAVLLSLATQCALAGEPAADSKPAVDTKAAETKEFKPPPGFVTKKKGQLTVYCVKDSTVGTRFKTERCYDQNQLRDYLAAREENKQNVDRIRNTCGGGTACATN
jgi:hypothetical protein